MSYALCVPPALGHAWRNMLYATAAAAVAAAAAMNMCQELRVWSFLDPFGHPMAGGNAI